MWPYEEPPATPRSPRETAKKNNRRKASRTSRKRNRKH